MANDGSTGPPLPRPLARARDGRVLAGVCAGIARQSGIPVGAVRAAFAAVTLIGGVGALVYLACWLIIPAEGDEEPSGPRGIVVLAQALAACAGLATLVALGGAATIFGFGWAVFAVAAAVLAAALLGWPRIGPGWALLPVAALALPAVAMAVGGVRLAPRADLDSAPRTVADLPRSGYRGGVGTTFIDLRHTALPVVGTIRLHIDGGLRRTIVALPAARCVHVSLRYDAVPFLSGVSDLLAGRSPYTGVVFFGRAQYGSRGFDANLGRGGAGPLLRIDFHSQGGSLYVRDYPDRIAPQFQPDWPGYPVFVEPRPDVAGMPPRAARRLLRAWRARVRVEAASARQINRLLPGPCAPATSARP